MIVVIFPNTAQINRNHFLLYEKLKFVLDNKMLTSDEPQKALRKFCADQNIMVLDLLPYYRARADERFFWETDDHMNTEGSQLAADAIYEFLIEKTAIGRRVVN